MSDEAGSALDPEKIPRRRGLHIRDIKEEAPEPEQTVGTELKAAREAAGKELHEVAATLRIKPEHLTALEAAEYDRLPAKTYVVGFVRQYAQHVGLDANELVERLKAELEGAEAPAEAPRKAETKARTGPVRIPAAHGGRMGPAEEDSRLPTMSIAVVAILLVVVVLGGWYLTRSSGSDNPAAEKKTETSSLPARVQGEEPSGGGLPKPPLTPASGEARDGAAAAPGRGSLTALLPGADRIAPADDSPAEDAARPPAMPDAAALAVPIENAGEAGAGAGTGAEGGETAADPPRGEQVVADAMPRPNLAVKTVPSHLPGLPEGAAGQREASEPRLAEIEAEGVGGEGGSNGATGAATTVQPRPKQVAAARGPGEYSASAVKSRITLRVRSSTWVRVEDADGRVIIERDMRSGDSFRAPDIEGLYLVTKDAGAIELLLDGESIGRAGQPNQVLTGLQLAPEKLRQHVAQNSGPAIR